MNARSDIFIAGKLTENRSSPHLLVMCQTPVFDPYIWVLAFVLGLASASTNLIWCVLRPRGLLVCWYFKEEFIPV